MTGKSTLCKREVISYYLIVGLMVAVMTVCISLTTYASEIETNIDQILSNRGYPQIVLDNLDDDAKTAIAADDVTFAGAVISYYNENDSTFTEISINEDGSYIAPRGQISTSDLTLTFAYSKNKLSSGVLNYISVTYSYNWNNLPFFRWQDPVSVSWDNTKFEMTDNSFSKIDKYDGYIVDSAGNLHGPYTNQVHSSENGYASASNAGVTWYADLKGYTGISPTRLYGSGSFKLHPKTTTSSGSSTLYGHYVHPTTSASLSVNR